MIFFSPLSPAYWREAAGEFRKLRVLVFAAFIAALRIVTGALYIPLGENLRMLFYFLPESIGGLVCGPLLGVGIGAIADLLGYFLFPSGPFFPGYTLSAMLNFLLFALFFYRAKISVLRVFLARLTINLFIHVGLGSLWSSIMFGKAYLYYAAKSLIKNAILLVPEVIVIVAVLRLLMPLLARLGYIPAQQNMSFGFKNKFVGR
ncbi:MAG: folate family ECF transporter S component [Oscillospiraceae bacterium]|jgi:ECF transporter S component (folate family)